MTKDKRGVSARTDIIQLVKEWKVEEGAWQYRELGSAHGGAFEGGTGTLFNFHCEVTTNVCDCLDQGDVLRM